MDINIHTNRLRLVPFEMSRLEAYYLGFDQETTQYQYPDPFASMEAAEEALGAFIAQMERGEMLFLSILTLDGAFAGGIELHGLEEPYPEVGLWIQRDQRRKGYAFEALDGLLGEAGCLYHKDWYVYEADIRNRASMKLAEKFHRRETGTDDEFYTETGKHLMMRKYLIRPMKSKG